MSGILQSLLASFAAGEKPFFLYAWGFNNNGYLGLNDTTSRSSPTQVTSGAGDWGYVTTTRLGGMATGTDGTLWTWGRNAFGELGLGDTTSRSSPVQVGSLTNWEKSFGGRQASGAIKTDGTLWMWGLNNNRQLGIPYNTTNRSSPVLIASGSTWIDATTGYLASFGIKTDGTLWSWGYEGSGQLGLGTSGYGTSNIQQVGALTNWAQVSSGRDAAFCGAVKTDGTLWMWGNNNSGKLGLGDTSNRSSPTQVGSLTTWSRVDLGRDMAAAVKTGGTFWTWGNNFSGALGLGDSTNRSSPVQVGSLTTWRQFAGGESISFGTLQS